MSSQLSLDELRSIIKNKYLKPVNMLDEKDKLINYYLGLLSVMLYEPDKPINEIKDNLINKYNNISLNDIPNPEDILYFTTGEKKDLLGPINDIKNKLKEQNGISTGRSSGSDSDYIIYDNDYEMKKALNG